MTGGMRTGKTITGSTTYPEVDLLQSMAGSWAFHRFLDQFGAGEIRASDHQDRKQYRYPRIPLPTIYHPPNQTQVQGYPCKLVQKDHQHIFQDPQVQSIDDFKDL